MFYLYLISVYRYLLSVGSFHCVRCFSCCISCSSRWNCRWTNLWTRRFCQRSRSKWILQIEENQEIVVRLDHHHTNTQPRQFSSREILLTLHGFNCNSNENSLGPNINIVLFSFFCSHPFYSHSDEDGKIFLHMKNTNTQLLN